jgi:hypothetical protein
MTTQRFELTLEATAEVVRGCCGGDHEFGECPLDQPADQKEADDGQG